MAQRARCRVGVLVSAGRGLRIALLVVLWVTLIGPAPGAAQDPAQACREARMACSAACEALRREAGEANCPPGYCDCYNQVHVCTSQHCSFAFDTFFAPAPGYLGCAHSAHSTRLTCLTGCNAAARASHTNPAWRRTLFECGRGCESARNEGVLACKATACGPACAAQGRQGVWYPRNLPLWESCQCTEPLAPVPTDTPLPEQGVEGRGALLQGNPDIQRATIPSTPSHGPVRRFRMRLDYAFGAGEIVGYTKICYHIQGG